MNVLFVSAEVAPFAKTGGLGDVSAALPRHLGARGHDVRIFAPLYRRVREGGHDLSPVPELTELSVAVGNSRLPFSVVSGTLPDSEVPVYFVDIPWLYDRPGIYTEAPDEHRRFLALTYAALRSCQALGFAPDIAHVNDWQAALLPLLLRCRFAWDKGIFGRTKTVLTIHNLAHQGAFPAEVLPDTGLEDSAHLFHQDQLRSGVLSFLTTGILYADAVTTVSPTYAREIQTDDDGMGLARLLRERSSTVVGILNGIDPSEWSPEVDPLIPHRYTAETLETKEENKKALLSSLGMPYDPEVPVAGVVTRLVWQKGLELILEAVPPLLVQGRLQLAVLGSGATTYEAAFAELQHRLPGKVCFYRGYSNELAHLIEAGADLFLMPSRFEPCGLNQMYSLAYGTPPVVRETGGLADTVHHFDPVRGTGNGFVFEHFTGHGLRWALEEALRVWPDRESWRRLQKNGMAEDHSWDARIGVYEELYSRVQEL